VIFELPEDNLGSLLTRKYPSDVNLRKKLFVFDDLVWLTTEMKDLFSIRHVHADCDEMKKIMVANDLNRDGRLYMHEFYHMGESQRHEFVEHEDLLRYSGSLDTTGEIPTVIIPNYIGSYTNCIGGSNTYTFCCKDECELFFTRIEKYIRAPNALPSDILHVVETTLVGDHLLHTVPAELRIRLQNIAGQNRGYVPIYGRLFAQWLHYLYPQHCRYPEYQPIDQMSVTTKNYGDKYGIPPFHELANLPTIVEEWHKLYNDVNQFLKDQHDSSGNMLLEEQRNGYARLSLLKYWDPREKLPYQRLHSALLSWKFVGRVMNLMVFVLGIAALCYTIFNQLSVLDDFSWPSKARKSHIV